MNQVFIVDALRTPIARSLVGALRHQRSDTMVSHLLKGLFKRQSKLADKLEMLVLGCAMQESSQALNIARNALLLSMPQENCLGMSINQLELSGIGSVVLANSLIQSGVHSCVIAGGVESMSLIPPGGRGRSPQPELMEVNPDLYLSSGVSAEWSAQHHKLSREDLDKYSLSSHQKASAAMDHGISAEEILPMEWTEKVYQEGALSEVKMSLSSDELPEDDLDMKKLSQRPVLMGPGSIITEAHTAPFSDGAALLLLVSEELMNELKLKPLAKLVGSKSVAGAPKERGRLPAVAIEEVLKSSGLKKSDIDLFQIGEPFSSMALGVIRKLKLDEKKVNVCGGGVAIGHPIGATGAIMATSLIREMSRRKSKRGLLSLCATGGQAVAVIFESVS